MLYLAMGDYATALALAEQARDIRKKALGEDHPDSAASANHRHSLTRPNVRPSGCYVVGGSHCIGNDACFTQDDTFRDTHQVTGGNNHILGKGAVYLRTNVAFIIDAEHLPTGGAHYAVTTEKIERPRNGVAGVPVLNACAKSCHGPGVLVAYDSWS